MGTYMQDLAWDIHDCHKCELCRTRIQAVTGQGVRDAFIMIVGEAPGETEDIEGKPFVGRCGRYLKNMLKGAGFEGRWCYITNLVKCRPPNNRAPAKEEVKACEGWIHREIIGLQPKMILCFGRYAGAWALGRARSTKLMDMRGQWHKPGAIPVRVLPHPSYLMQHGRDEEEDVKAELRGIVEEAKGMIARGEVRDGQGS